MADDPTPAEPAQLPLEQQAANWKAAAEQFRGQVKALFGQARQINTPEAWVVALTHVRAIQDSLEEFVALGITVKGAMERAAQGAQLAYDEAWARESSSYNSTAVRRGPEIEGPRERYAHVDLKVFAQLRALRQAESRVNLAREVNDEMWLRYRAVNATREDIAQILRGFTIERSLERT